MTRTSMLSGLELVSLDVEGEWLTPAELARGERAAEPRIAIHAALRSPEGGGADFIERVRGKRLVVVVPPVDHEAPAAPQPIVREALLALAERLEEASLPSSRITLLVTAGLDRRPAAGAWSASLGRHATVFGREELFDAEALEELAACAPGGAELPRSVREAEVLLFVSSEERAAIPPRERFAALVSYRSRSSVDGVQAALARQTELLELHATTLPRRLGSGASMLREALATAGGAALWNASPRRVRRSALSRVSVERRISGVRFGPLQAQAERAPSPVPDVLVVAVADVGPRAPQGDLSPLSALHEAVVRRAGTVPRSPDRKLPLVLIHPLTPLGTGERDAPHGRFLEALTHGAPLAAAEAQLSGRAGPISAYRRGQSVHPGQPFALWQEIELARAALGPVLSGGGSSGLAHRLGLLVESSPAAALRQAVAFAGVERPTILGVTP